MTAGQPTLAAGIDVGGTVTKAAALSPDGTVVASLRRATNAAGGRAVLSTAKSALTELGELVGIRPNEFDVIGVAVPGIVDPAAGTVRYAANLGIDGRAVPLGNALAEAVGVPCAIENDTNAGALGALVLVAPPATKDLIYLSVGTGIAAGIILDGHLWRGRRGVAGEIGHLPVDPLGPQCLCGRRGCLETVASGTAMGRQWPSRDDRPPAVSLFGAAATGDRAAIAVRDEAVGHLASTIELLALTIDVECVIVGGGVAEVGAPLLTALRARLSASGAGSFLHEVLGLADRVLLAQGQEPLGAIGAAVAARQATRRRSDDPVMR